MPAMIKIKPDELLKKIEAGETLTNSYHVILYGPIPRERRTSDDDTRELEEHAQQIKTLELLLKHRACPEHLTVEVMLTNEYNWWPATTRDRTPVEPIFTLLTRGACPKGLTLVLTQKQDNAYLRQFELEALQKALTSDVCPQDLALKFSDPIEFGRHYFNDSWDAPSKYAEVEYLKRILESGKCPWGFKLEYTRPQRISTRDKEQFDKLDTLLTNYERQNIHKSMCAVCVQITKTLDHEIRSMLRRKGINVDVSELNLADKKRYDVLLELKTKITHIATTAIDNIEGIDLLDFSHFCLRASF